MDTRRQNNYPTLLLFMCLVSMTFAGSCGAKEFDFERLLIGLTADSGEDQLIAEQKIKIELNGREDEVFEYVVAVLHDESGAYGAAHITEGLRALIILDSFSSNLLNSYRDLLIREAEEVESLTILSQKRLAKLTNERERTSLTKRLAFVESGFYIFEQHDSPLPHEVAAAFLPFNDRGIIEPVIRWYRAYGSEADIPTLKSRAEELEKLGGTILAGAIDEAILNIQARANATIENEGSGVPPTDPNRSILDSSEASQRALRSNGFRFWLMIVPSVVAVIGALIWRRKRHQR